MRVSIKNMNLKVFYPEECFLKCNTINFLNAIQKLSEGFL